MLKQEANISRSPFTLCLVVAFLAVLAAISGCYDSDPNPSTDACAPDSTGAYPQFVTNLPGVARATVQYIDFDAVADGPVYRLLVDDSTGLTPIDSNVFCPVMDFRVSGSFDGGCTRESDVAVVAFRAWVNSMNCTDVESAAQGFIASQGGGGETLLQDLPEGTQVESIDPGENLYRDLNDDETLVGVGG